MYWIRKLLGLCNHRWVVVDQVRMIGYESGAGWLLGYVLRCEHCGAVKKKGLL